MIVPYQHIQLNTTQLQFVCMYCQTNRQTGTLTVRQSIDMTYHKKPKICMIVPNHALTLSHFNASSDTDIELDGTRSFLEHLRLMVLQQQKENSQNLQIWQGNQCLWNSIPLVLEHFGQWGWKANQFLQKLSQLSIDNESKGTAMIQNLWKPFSCHLAPLQCKCSFKELCA